MKIKKIRKLNIKGVLLDKNSLCNYLETLASDQIIKKVSSKDTFPMQILKENFNYITEVYKLLNQCVLLKINIHPAGEWLLDNYYIIEERVKEAIKTLKLSKYCNLPGIDGGYEDGFARIYVIANIIVSFTEGKIEAEALESFLNAYQTKKSLTMEEIWNIPLFLNISIIEHIREVCEKIFISQIQKYKVESIIERLIEQKQKEEQCFNKQNFYINVKKEDMSYPFIEYMSYKLKRYGKKGYPYLQILEEQIERMGSSVSDVIKKEHFDIAVKKVLIGNLIISLKEISKIDFSEMYERLGGIEEILKKDPANEYKKMDYNSKNIYRNKIKEIAYKGRISEIFVAKKVLEMCKGKNGRSSHIGYYLLEDEEELYKKLGIKFNKLNSKQKAMLYSATNIILPFFLSFCLFSFIFLKRKNIFFSFFSAIISYLPLTEITVQTINYILRESCKT